MEDKVSAWRKFKRLVRRQDIFGVGVTLNLNKEGEHTTLIGGICSIMLVSFCSFIFI